MIDRNVLGQCGFELVEKTMFFASNVEVHYHPSGIWIPFSDDPEADLLNKNEFSNGDIILDGDSCDMEAFYHVLIQQVADNAYLRGFEEGINYDDDECDDDVEDDDDEYDNDEDEEDHE
jgi:hypothetical protein